MSCFICEELEKRSKEVIFQDDRVAVILSKTPASLGHILVAPKQHYTILEQVPDDILGELFVIANKLSILLFETLNAQGTNMIIQNGVVAGQSENHFFIHVIPRRQNDGLNFEWELKKATDDELATARLKYEPFCKDLLVAKQSKPAASPLGPKAEESTVPIEAKGAIEIKQEKDRVNYLLSNLDRIP
ncbi:MAG: HIT family protein [Candidatus Woesearchaeota archaeon]